MSNFIRSPENNWVLEDIPLAAQLQPGAFAARLATLPVTKASHPLLHFVRKLEPLVPDPLRPQLKRWVDGVAGRLGVEAPPLALAGQGAKAEGADNEPTRLVVCLEPDLYKPDYYAVNAWLFRWGRDVKVVCDHTELTRDHVVDLINKQLHNLPHTELREVELFLPAAKLAEGIARWEVTVARTQKVALDMRFPVKLRCLDRLPSPNEGEEDDDDSDFDGESRRLWANAGRSDPAPGSL